MTSPTASLICGHFFHLSFSAKCGPLTLTSTGHLKAQFLLPYADMDPLTTPISLGQSLDHSMFGWLTMLASHLPSASYRRFTSIASASRHLLPRAAGRDLTPSLSIVRMDRPGRQIPASGLTGIYNAHHRCTSLWPQTLKRLNCLSMGTADDFVVSWYNGRLLTAVPAVSGTAV